MISQNGVVIVKVYRLLPFDPLDLYRTIKIRKLEVISFICHHWTQAPGLAPWV